MREVKNKVVAITGSAQGLGKGFAQHLLREGAKVCISDFNEELGRKTTESLQEIYGKGNVHFIKCNVLQEADLISLVDGTISHFGRLDIFCNNAGVNHTHGRKKCMDIDIMAVLESTEIALSRMRQDQGGPGGLIVNTASLAGLIVGGGEDSLPYFVAKHGVVCLTRTMGAQEVVQKTGVEMVSFCPSFADTELARTWPTHAKKISGVMSVEEAADAFMELVKYGESGDALTLFKGVPPYFFPDVSKKILQSLWCTATILKNFGVRRVRIKHVFFLVFLAVMLLHLATLGIYMISFAN